MTATTVIDDLRQVLLPRAPIIGRYTPFNKTIGALLMYECTIARNQPPGKWLQSLVESQFDF